jgi:ADP-glucose pyrophosphorylase
MANTSDPWSNLKDKFLVRPRHPQSLVIIPSIAHNPSLQAFQFDDYKNKVKVVVSFDIDMEQWLLLRGDEISQ